MPWNCIKITVAPNEVAGVAEATFDYAHEDGRTKKIIERVSRIDSLNVIAFNAINELNRIDEVTKFISDNQGQELQYVAPIPPPLTDIQIAMQNYLNKKSELVAAKQDLDLGLIDQAAFDSLKSEVIALKP